ncbi:Gfo/Idh/MocA family protein [Burkholderia multivorans]|uniref:Gfo/Idh/MocA family protein n=1 Tax=Burkholderia multivorans TaxID=87883 RepID=UPI000D011705|nr:Gfo/Idh/MocA family oxidoreductase [Burkholderia multivorans]MBU9400117.1 Gfo/Idh/MocA family oxidoreductase [Burkholderia multivorans]MDN8045720.1 Gfo/Idh/MocA family oxidoreductase [Burkholderia multivorans]PRH31061.1 gfo/Idh/MocA family oxidoreductase [Burkholderia multivorans]
MARRRLAVIGAGAIGRMHVERARVHPQVEVVAIADPSPAAEQFARAEGLRWFADYAAMLDEVRPDGAIVATPNATHVAVGLACIARGVPALIEKPVSDSVDAADAMSRAAREAGVPLLVGHHRRHNPILRRAREIVQSGRLGRPVAANALATFYKPDAYFDVEWRRQAGGGPVLINLIHDIDIMRFLLGEIVEVCAQTSNGVRGFDVEDTAAVLLRFDSGALGTLAVSDCAVSPWNWDLAAGEAAHYPRQQVNTHFLIGTDASLTLPQLDLWAYRGAKGWHEPLTVERCTPHDADPYHEQMRHFAAVIAGDEAPLCSADDAARTLAATLAVHRAVAARTAVAPAAVVSVNRP